MVIRQHRKGNCPPAVELQKSGERVHPRDGPRLGEDPAFGGRAGEAPRERSPASGARQRGEKGAPAWVPAHTVEDPGQGERRGQVRGGEAGAVHQRELRRIKSQRVDEEPAFHREALPPGTRAAELTPELLEEHLGEPVLAGVEYWEDPIPSRA